MITLEDGTGIVQLEAENRYITQLTSDQLLHVIIMLEEGTGIVQLEAENRNITK